MKAIQKKILLASVAVGVITPFFGGGAVSAESVTVQPTNPSDNEVEVNEKDYTINGEKTELGEDDYGDVYGGYSDAGETIGNILIVNGGKINLNVWGGHSYTNNSNNNTVIINGGKINGSITAGWSYGNANANSNSIIINGATFNGASGGWSYGGNSNDNNLTINNGAIDGTTVWGFLNGGYSSSNTADNNHLTINGGTINGTCIISAGYGKIVTNNSINIYNSPYLNGAIIYGYAETPTTHSGNTLNIYTKNLNAQNVANFDNMNFYLDSNISNGDTLLTLIGGSQTDVSSTDIKAVMQSGSPLTNGDTVTLLTNASGVTEAKSYTGTAAEGVSLTYPLTVYRNDEGTAILARLGSTDTSGTDSSGTDSSGTDSSGSDSSGTDSSGTDSSGSDSSGTDSSGSDSSGSDSSGSDSSGTDSSGTDSSGTDSSGSDTSAVDDSNNTVNLYSTNSGTIYGGYTDSGNASNNTVNLYSGTFENIYGGYAPAGETSNNTLNVYNKNISAQNLSNFSAMNFYIPNDASNGDTMLTLTDTSGTDLSGVVISAGVVAGNENLAVGDTINLLTNSNGFKTDSATSYGRLTEGVSLDYGLTVSNGGSNILATIDSVPQKLNSVTQEIPLGGGLTSIKTVDAILDNNTLPDIGLDFDFESDSDDDTSAAEISEVVVTEPKGWEIFASAGGGSLKTKAGDGAFVDMKFSSFDVGFARTLENGGAGKLVFAPIIDYAHGNYDSYLADGTHGTGSTKYIAGGGVFRNMWDNGFYVEGSFRAGKVRNDFASNDMDKTFGQRVSYDTKATAMAGHFKLGKNLRLNRNNLLDIYATYYHAHQGGMNADLNPYGDKYRISSANSGRFRIGYRMTTRTSKISRIYTGLAYQYEHSSGITANYLSKNLSTASAGNSGSSGMLELGWQIKPLQNNPWTVDINATGWVGHQRGVTAFAKIQKAF